MAVLHKRNSFVKDVTYARDDLQRAHDLRLNLLRVPEAFRYVLRHCRRWPGTKLLLPSQFNAGKARSH